MEKEEFRNGVKYDWIGRNNEIMQKFGKENYSERFTMKTQKWTGGVIYDGYQKLWQECGVVYVAVSDYFSVLGFDLAAMNLCVLLQHFEKRISHEFLKGTANLIGRDCPNTLYI
jgi:hypothetical protein